MEPSKRPRMLRAKDVAMRLGVSIATFRRYTRSGECPPFRRLPTGILVFEDSAVEDWLAGLDRSGGKK